MINIIGEVDKIARSIESKYGTEYKDRIPDELYEKFERQKEKQVKRLVFS